MEIDNSPCYSYLNLTTWAKLKPLHYTRINSFYVRFDCTAVFRLYASDGVLGRMEKRSVHFDFSFVGEYGEVLWRSFESQPKTNGKN
jgi:hypothetical protein